MATARVNIEADAWTDLRFAALAQLLGLPGGHEHALILCAKIWSWQTAHYTPDAPTYVVDHAIADGVLGAGGAAALVTARLAEEHPDGLRIRGSEGRIEWLFRCAENGRNSKRARKQVAPAAAPAAELPRPLSSVSLSSGDPDLSPARVAPPAVPEPGDPGLVQRQALRKELWHELATARGRVARELGKAYQPLLGMDPGETKLALLLRGAGSELGQIASAVRNAIAVAAAEAKRDQDLKWLTGAIFEERNFRRLAAGDPIAAARPRPAKPGEPVRMPPRRADPSPPVLVVSDADRADAAAALVESRAKLFGLAGGG